MSLTLNAIMTSYTEPLKMSDIWAHLTGSQSISVAVNACMHDARFQNDPAVINTVDMSPKKNSVTRYAYVERENQIKQIKSTKALVSMAPCSSRVRVQPMSEDNYSHIHTWINIQRGNAADLDLFDQFVVQISTCGIKLLLQVVCDAMAQALATTPKIVAKIPVVPKLCQLS